MNTNKLLAIGFIMVAVLLFSACAVARGSGRVIIESREVSGFDRVELGGSGDLIITQGETESLTVETDDNMMQYVVTNVRGHTLYLGTNAPQVAIFSPTRLRFTLQVKELSGLVLSGSGSITADTIVTDQFEIEISGSGSARLDQLTTEQLRAEISGSGAARVDDLATAEMIATVSGSGTVQVAGASARSDFTVNGSGGIRADDLQSDRVNINISGSGTATVWAVETLDINVSGSGSVRYYGTPTLNSSTSGSGTVSNLGGK